MEIINNIKKLREIIVQAKSKGKLVGLVPTMGYLHDGHLSLVARSREHTDYQVMSIFVNKIQFNNTDDFENYPKDFERDLKLAEKNGVDLIFIPDDKEMYNNNLTHVRMELLTENLCGAHRPGHFEGVFTVVSKLFNIVQPDVAVFGQKDIQQAICIEKMVTDLNFPVKIIISPIVREKDGLAMSSRNKHMNPENRKNSLKINQALIKCDELLHSGIKNVAKITDEMKKIILEGKPEKIDYITAVKYSDLTEIDTIKENSIIAIAAFFNSTRLIDNMIIKIDGDKIKCIY